MEKLNALFVLFRGDAGAVAAFVGPSRDIGDDSVWAAIYGRFSVVRRACPWAQPDNLPLFVQLLFGGGHEVGYQFGMRALDGESEAELPFPVQPCPSARAMPSRLVQRPHCHFLLQGISTAQAQSAGILQDFHRSVEPTA